MEDLYYRYNPWWEKKDYRPEEAKARPKDLEAIRRSERSNRVVFITGLRRVGKSTLMKMYISELIGAGTVKPSRVFYVSLDDYRLSKKSLLDMVEDFRKIHGLSHKDPVRLFLDEVTYQESFALQIKNLFDAGAVRIVASSSSASLLCADLHLLTGRRMTHEVLPLDFSGYLRFREITTSKGDPHLLDRHFEDFLLTGGIPEFVLHKEMDYLKDLVDDIIRKDIASHYKVRDVHLLMDYFLLLMERAGKALSINKAARILGISPDSARRYLDMFEETYLVHTIRRRGKTNERLLSPKKVYASDLGIRTLFTGVRDKGSLFENYVFLKIKHRNPEYIYQDSTELDFFTEDGTLLEAKFGSILTPAQETLFKAYPAKARAVIASRQDAERL